MPTLSFNAIRQAQVVAQADIVGDIAANVAHMPWNPGRKRGNFFVIDRT